MAGPKTEIILVKYNAPGYESAAIAAVLENTRDCRYSLRAHQNEPKVGLAKCWNQLIRATDAKYVCLLNTDTVVTPGWLANLVDVLEQEPDVAAVVPSSNHVHLSQIETPLDRFETDWDKIYEFAASFADFELRELDTCSAMCVVFPREVWANAGGFDEEFFLYGEDTEFFYRVRASGLGRILWHTGVYVHHYGQRSMILAANSDEALNYSKVRVTAQELWDRKKAEIDAQYGVSGR